MAGVFRADIALGVLAFFEMTTAQAINTTSFAFRILRRVRSKAVRAYYQASYRRVIVAQIPHSGLTNARIRELSLGVQRCARVLITSKRLYAGRTRRSVRYSVSPCGDRFGAGTSEIV